MKKLFAKIDSFFEISKRNSSFSKEIIGGILIFFAMIYILPVNSAILSAAGLPPGAVFAATALCSGISCFVMGLFAKVPIALSAGMGLNAYLAFTVCGQLGYTWQEGLAVVIVSGILFFIFTLTPIRKWIINAIPKSLKYAISAGLGAFICFVGLKMSGLIVSDSSTLVALANLNPETSPHVLLALFGIVLVFVLMACRNKFLKRFSILIAMIVVAVVGVILNAVGVNNMPSFTSDMGSITDIKDVFGQGFLSIPSILSKPQTYGVIFAFIMVHLFDTTAMVISIGEQVGLVDENTGHMDGKVAKKAFVADATGGLISGIFGTSPITSFAESTVGVEFGARGGLAPIITGLLFFLSLAIFPVFNVFAGINIDGSTFTPCSSLALVAVGAMMFTNLKNIDWNDKILVCSSFVIFIMMILTYSITNGIAFGIIFYALMKLASLELKGTSPVIWILAIVFLALLIVNTIIANIDTHTDILMSSLQIISQIKR